MIQKNQGKGKFMFMFVFVVQKIYEVFKNSTHSIIIDNDEG